MRCSIDDAEDRAPVTRVAEQDNLILACRQVGWGSHAALPVEDVKVLSERLVKDQAFLLDAPQNDASLWVGNLRRGRTCIPSDGLSGALLPNGSLNRGEDRRHVDVPLVKDGSCHRDSGEDREESADEGDDRESHVELEKVVKDERARIQRFREKRRLDETQEKGDQLVGMKV